MTHAFAPIEDYIAAQTCPRCHAQPGQQCAGAHSATYARTGGSHLPRVDRAIAHYNRDVGNAPWPDEREAARCYSTLPTTKEK